MLSQIITSIMVILLSIILGYHLGNNECNLLEKRNLKLQLQNKVLEKECHKLYDIINHFKDKRNDLIVDDKAIIIYYPTEDNNIFIEELELWAND